MDKQEKEKVKEVPDLSNTHATQALQPSSKKSQESETLPDDEFYGLGYNNRRSRLPQWAR